MNVLPPIIGAPYSGRTTLKSRLAEVSRSLVYSAEPRLIALIDWREGLRDETLWQLGVLTPDYQPRLILAINKLDLAGFEYEAFKSARSAALAKLAALRPEHIKAVPISAKFGDGVAAKSDRIEWYSGPALVDLIAAPAPFLIRERQAA